MLRLKVVMSCVAAEVEEVFHGSLGCYLAAHYFMHISICIRYKRDKNELILYFSGLQCHKNLNKYIVKKIFSNFPFLIVPVVFASILQMTNGNTLIRPMLGFYYSMKEHRPQKFISMICNHMPE